jgi:hypothetical protein
MNETLSMDNARNQLREWLFRRLDEPARKWIADQLSMTNPLRDNRSLFTSFALMGRKLGKVNLDLSMQEQAVAMQCLDGWMPGEWSLLDAGRILLLSGLPGKNPDFAPRFIDLCQTAEVAEAVSLYRGLPLYPEPESLESQVGEGLRGNMRSVFEAIAHHNPYPRRFFDTHRWNHMVLKAIFIGSRLAPIQGLDARANAELARIMLDFVHERRAAGREVPFEIWRCVGPFATDSALGDLEWVLTTGSPREQRAAALALAASPDPDAATLLQQAPVLASEIAAGRLDWAMLK